MRLEQLLEQLLLEQLIIKQLLIDQQLLEQFLRHELLGRRRIVRRRRLERLVLRVVVATHSARAREGLTPRHPRSVDSPSTSSGPPPFASVTTSSKSCRFFACNATTFSSMVPSVTMRDY